MMGGWVGKWIDGQDRWMEAIDIYLRMNENCHT